MNQNPHIQRAIDVYGSQADLAQAITVSQQHVSALLCGRKRPSIRTAIAISNATGGAVPFAVLRPDVVEAIQGETNRGDGR